MDNFLAAILRGSLAFARSHLRMTAILESQMPPRVRSLLPRMPFDRASGTKVKKAGEAPRVFREFVETLQRLDAPAQPLKRAGASRLAARKRGHAGNGHKRPRRKANGA